MRNLAMNFTLVITFLDYLFIFSNDVWSYNWLFRSKLLTILFLDLFSVIEYKKQNKKQKRNGCYT